MTDRDILAAVKIYPQPMFIVRCFTEGWAPRFVSCHKSRPAAERRMRKLTKAMRLNPPRLWNPENNTWNARLSSFDVFEA
jgi:hypothetical protein